MAKTNTEKPMGQAQKKKEATAKAPKQKLEKTNITNTEKKPLNKDTEKKEEIKKEITKKKKEIKVKKTEAIVNVKGVPVSTKYSMAICRFIKNKKIEKAIKDLEDVLQFKKAVPMKGEIPHRKGKKIMSGRYPKRATEHFIKLLKSLLANANHNGLENPIITEAVSNIGKRPFGKFGRIRRKRTHIKITAKEKNNKN